MQTKVNKKELADDALTMLLAAAAITLTLVVDVLTSVVESLRKKIK